MSTATRWSRRATKRPHTKRHERERPSAPTDRRQVCARKIDAAQMAPQNPPSTCLFLPELPPDLTDAILERHFRGFVGYDSCRTRHDRNGKLVGFVEFETIDDAVRCRENQQGQSPFPGVNWHIHFSNSQGRPASGATAPGGKRPRDESGPPVPRQDALRHRCAGCCVRRLRMATASRVLLVQTFLPPAHVPPAPLPRPSHRHLLHVSYASQQRWPLANGHAAPRGISTRSAWRARRLCALAAGPVAVRPASGRQWRRRRGRLRCGPLRSAPAGPCRSDVDASE